MEEGRFDITDRISELPEPLLQHILSFLFVKDAANTSLLSKSWYNAWTTLPYLNFGESFFPKARGRGVSFSPMTREADKKKVQELLNVVDVVVNTRLKQKSSIHKFCLELPSYDEFDLAPYIERFLSLLTEGNIKELVFKVEVLRGKLYTLPEAIYAAKSLQALELHGTFKLESPCTTVKKLSSLRKLHLRRTYADNQQIQLLLMSYPDLELLRLDECSGFDTLQVSGLLKLEKVELVNCPTSFEGIEIQAPSLQHLFHYGLGKLYKVNVNACKSLKFLELFRLNCTPNWTDDLFSNLPLLETFRLTNCEGLETIRASSNRLKRLDLWDCNDLVNVEVDAPNLSKFFYAGPISINFSLKASPLLEMRFSIPDGWKRPETPDLQCQNKLIEFLRKFNHCKALTFLWWNPAKLIISKDIREKLCSPLSDVKCLSVEGLIGNESAFLDLVDSLLWIAPCLDNLSIVSRGSYNGTLKFIYEIPTHGVEKPCCSSVPINCWHRSLKKVEFVNFEHTEDFQKLKNYFVENAKILESIDGLNLPEYEH